MVTLQDWHRELKERRRKVWNIVQGEGCDIGLVYSSQERPEPFRYLTNFVPVLGDMWAIQTAADAMTCVLNFHWELNEAGQVSGLADWQGYFDPLPFLFEKLAELKPARIAVLGMERMPWKVHTWLGQTLGVELVPVDEHLNLLRRVKAPLEVQLLREAVRVTDLAFTEDRGARFAAYGWQVLHIAEVLAGEDKS